MKFAPYNNYKPSNSGWVRDIPTYWELKRLKYIANRVEVKVEADEDKPVPYVGRRCHAIVRAGAAGLHRSLMPWHSAGHRLGELIDAGDPLFIPMAAIVEVGNHIAHVGHGAHRRAAAQRFVTVGVPGRFSGCDRCGRPCA